MRKSNLMVVVRVISQIVQGWKINLLTTKYHRPGDTLIKLVDLDASVLVHMSNRNLNCKCIHVRRKNMTFR